MKNYKIIRFALGIIFIALLRFAISGEMICNPATGVCHPAEDWLSEKLEETDLHIANIPQPAIRLYGLVSQEKLLNTLNFNDKTTTQKESADTKNFFASKHSFLIYFFVAVISGFILNFTPCVLPLLPVTLLIIQKGHEKKAKWRAILYALGCTLTCGIGGVIVISGWKGIHEVSSSPFFTLICGILFVFLGSALCFNLDVNPLRKLPKISASGPFWLGIINTALAGSCVAPVLLTLLLLAASNYAADNEIKWFLLPIAFGTGMALPWWSAAALLPKLPHPGKWMTKVKNIMSILIILTGIIYCSIGFAAILNNSNGDKITKQIFSSITESRQKKRPLLIKFSAANCGNCHVLNLTVWRKPLVRQALKRFNVLEISLDNRNDKQVRALTKHLNIAGVPAIFIWPTQ